MSIEAFRVKIGGTSFILPTISRNVSFLKYKDEELDLDIFLEKSNIKVQSALNYFLIKRYTKEEYIIADYLNDDVYIKEYIEIFIKNYDTGDAPTKCHFKQNTSFKNNLYKYMKENYDKSVKHNIIILNYLLDCDFVLHIENLIIMNNVTLEKIKIHISEIRKVTNIIDENFEKFYKCYGFILLDDDISLIIDTNITNVWKHLHCILRLLYDELEDSAKLHYEKIE